MEPKVIDLRDEIVKDNVKLVISMLNTEYINKVKRQLPDEPIMGAINESDKYKSNKKEK